MSGVLDHANAEALRGSLAIGAYLKNRSGPSVLGAVAATADGPDLGIIYYKCEAPAIIFKFFCVCPRYQKCQTIPYAPRYKLKVSDFLSRSEVFAGGCT